jgi:hypothetical protein
VTSGRDCSSVPHAAALKTAASPARTGRGLRLEDRSASPSEARSMSSNLPRDRLERGQFVTPLSSNFWRRGHGYRPLRSKISIHLLRTGRLHCVSRRVGHHGHARGHLPGDRHPGGVRDLAVHWPDRAGDGATSHNLQPVLYQLECIGHQKHRGANPQRHLGAEDLLSARRQSRPRHLADRRGDERSPRAVAGRHPAAARGGVQRLERSSAAAQPELRPPQRAEALRLRGSTICASSLRRCRA